MPSTSADVIVDGTVNKAYTATEKTKLAGVAASAIAGVTVKDEGTPLTTDATTLDFVGSGVTVTGTGATKTVTIPGGGSSPLYPYHAHIPAVMWPTASSSTPSISYASGSMASMAITVPVIASGNYLEWTFLAAAGTWQLRAWFPKNINQGIYRFLIDGVEVGTADSYNATFLANQTATISGLTVTEGRHTLRVQADAKNASATNYGITLNDLSLTRTGA